MANRKAYWIRTQNDYRHYSYTCSNCKTTIRHHKYPVCPVCGRKMKPNAVTKEEVEARLYRAKKRLQQIGGVT